MNRKRLTSQVWVSQLPLAICDSFTCECVVNTFDMLSVATLFIKHLNFILLIFFKKIIQNHLAVFLKNPPKKIFHCSYFHDGVVYRRGEKEKIRVYQSQQRALADDYL